MTSERRIIRACQDQHFIPICYYRFNKKRYITTYQTCLNPNSFNYLHGRAPLLLPSEINKISHLSPVSSNFAEQNSYKLIPCDAKVLYDILFSAPA